MNGAGRLRFLSKNSTYGEVQDILLNEPRLKAFPIVENRKNMILIGSCSRARLLRSLDMKVGVEARQNEAMRQITENIQVRVKYVASSLDLLFVLTLFSLLGH